MLRWRCSVGSVIACQCLLISTTRSIQLRLMSLVLDKVKPATEGSWNTLEINLLGSLNVCRKCHGNLSNSCWDVFIHMNIYVTLAPRWWNWNCHPKRWRIRSTMPRIETKEVQEFLSWSQVPNTKSFLTWGVIGVDIGADVSSCAPLILLQNAAIMIPERKTGRGVISVMSCEVVTGCCTHVICYLSCLGVGNTLCTEILLYSEQWQ